MLKNNQIDMFEEYFVNEESDHIVENISTKTLMLFKYFNGDLGTLQMSAREVSVRCPGMLMGPTSWQFHMPFPASSRLLTR